MIPSRKMTKAGTGFEETFDVFLGVLTWSQEE